MPKQNIVPKNAGGRSSKRKKPDVRERGRKGKKGAPPRENPTTQKAASPTFLELNLRREGPAGPRIPIGEALRERGIDERAIAGNYVYVLGKLTEQESDKGGVQKLLVDVLKECSRQIEASSPPPRASVAPVIVQLVHNVTRPARAQLPAADVSS
jgi:hypothetical protein